MVSAIAGRLRRMGLPTDAIVGIQLPNIVENILTILGVLRAGMIAAPLPLLWRRADARRRAGAHRRQGPDHLRPRRQLRALPVRHAGRRRSVFDPLRLRLRRRICPTAWCRSTICSPRRSSIRCRRSIATGKQCRRASRRHHLRHRRGRPGAGGAQSSRIAGRRLGRRCSKAGSSRTPAFCRPSRRRRSPASA